MRKNRMFTLVLVVMLPMAHVMKGLLEKGTMTQIGFAILIPVLIVLLRPEMEKLLSGICKVAGWSWNARRRSTIRPKVTLWLTGAAQ